eukprot:1160814-Pelagomonas_calceolata.AAC.11
MLRIYREELYNDNHTPVQKQHSSARGGGKKVKNGKVPTNTILPNLSQGVWQWYNRKHCKRNGVNWWPGWARVAENIWRGSRTSEP